MSKPIGEQPLQVLPEPAQKRIAPPEVDQLGAAIDEELDPFGERVELPQHGDTRRLQGRRAKRAPRQCAEPVRRPRSASDIAAWTLVVVDIEFAREQLQEALAAGRVEREIGAAEIGGAPPEP